MKVAWFTGKADEPEWEQGNPGDMSQDAIMAAAVEGDWSTPRLRLLLVPDDFDIRQLTGDDWDDRPASCNASEPYNAPEGSQWIDLRLGEMWPL